MIVELMMRKNKQGIYVSEFSLIIIFEVQLTLLKKQQPFLCVVFCTEDRLQLGLEQKVEPKNLGFVWARCVVGLKCCASGLPVFLL